MGVSHADRCRWAVSCRQHAHVLSLLLSSCAGCRYNYLDPTVNKGWDVAGVYTCVLLRTCVLWHMRGAL
jgi:hypothetical protein